MGRIGAMIAGRYRIERLAGEGGMSTVYRAHDHRGGGSVALKLLHQHDAHHETRFEREARLLSSVTHPGFVRYIDHGLDGEHGYLVMEWLEGEDLEERLARAPLSWSESVGLVMRVARALGAAHRQGIVHRDLKPSNLFLVAGQVERVKILDLGVARLVRDVQSATRTGTVVGTPLYMSPEQARGSRSLDARADVFSLGCVLHQCLTGAPPFGGNHVVQVLANILLREPPRLSESFADVPPALDDLALSMLAKEPEKRPRDGTAVAEALARIDGVSERAHPFTSVRPVALTTTEQRLLSIVLAAELGAGRPVDATCELSAEIEDETPELVHAVIALAARHGAEAQWMVDGSVLVSLHGSGTATDQAHRGARIALAIRSLAPTAPLALATGRGVVGRLPVGEVVESASDMLARTAHGAAPPIWIDEVTTGLLGERFDIGGDDRGLVLLGEAASESEARTLLGKPSPCVGRSRQLQALEAAMTECIEEPVARVMLVTGQPGIGKSRLRHELVRRLRERRDVEIWLGRGDPLGTRSPFGLLAPALLRTSGIRPRDTLEVKQKKLRARVARHLPPERVARVAAFVGELAGVSFHDATTPELGAARSDPLLLGDHMRRAWEDLVWAESRATTLAIVLDDVQWSDAPSIELVDSALRHCADAALFVAAFARPEIHDTFVNVWRARNVEELRLAGLSRKAGAALVRHALGASVPAHEIDTLVERAAGNAFYLEELIRAVSDGRGGRLPATVLAMVQARLDAVDPEARRVLRAASVFGRFFWRGAVERLLGEGAEVGDVERWLSLLCQDELVERRARSRFAGEEEYSFRHVLICDGAYAGLTERDRRVGHRLAGDWLERAGETDATLMAEHFDRAGEHGRAARAWRRSAEQALEAHDFEAAIVRANRCLSGETSPGSSADAGAMWLVRAEAQRWLGRFAEARESARAAVEMLSVGDAPWYHAVEELLTALGRLGEFEEARAWAERVTATPFAGAQNTQIEALSCAARVLFQAGDYQGADALMQLIQALVDGGEPIRPSALAEFHRLRGARARHVGDVAGDFEGYRAALEACEVGDERQACNARVSLGFSYIELGDHAAARRELEQALAAADRMNLSTVQSRARQNLALVCAAEGHLDEARCLAEQVIEECVAQGNVRFEGWTRIYLSRIELARGDAAAAQHQALLAAERTTVTPPARAGALAALALARLALDRPHEALDPALTAVETLAAFGGIEEFEALVRRAHVEALRASGLDDQAARAAERARARLHELCERIRDPEHRRSFLERVPDNARLLELAIHEEVADGD